MKRKKLSLSYTQIILLGFLALVFTGAVLLSLPISSRTGQQTPFVDALFTATSATSITGLVVYDTYSHWSIFGQMVLLFLIQIGGLGFMTILAVLFLALRRKMGLDERQLLVQASGMNNLGGVLPIIRRIAIMSFSLQGFFALLLSFRFIPAMGFAQGAYYAIFHAISAFCNAGFDLMGQSSPFSSLTGYAGDVLVNLTVILAVVSGGLGFIVWNDVWTHKGRFSKFSLHSKLVLSTTGILLLLAWLLFFLLEQNATAQYMSFGQRVLSALFQSAINRTAGFSTTSVPHLSYPAILLSMALMIVGGSTGSTAGGIKTTTAAILFLNAVNSVRKRHSLVVFRRRISDDTIKNASAITVIFLLLVLAATLLLTAMEPFSIQEALFEVISAVGTVGLSLGITPYLNTGGRILITALMLAGRVGLLTLLFALVKKHPDPPLERPIEKVLVG